MITIINGLLLFLFAYFSMVIFCQCLIIRDGYSGEKEVKNVIS